MFPHDLMRCTHMKHHAYTNNPEKDPDYDTASAKSLWEVIVPLRRHNKISSNS